MFSGLGLDVLRLRNRYGLAGDDDLGTAGEIVRGAAEHLGRAPTVMLTSWSPPSALKASGALVCAGNADTCTLARDESGAFDYAGFAEHWRASLEAYAAVGVVPDYIGIQNNPDFVPDAANPGEGCAFLPAQGTTTVTVGGLATEVEYPGFAEALSAVLRELPDSGPRIAAPETSGIRSLPEYAAQLEDARVDVLAHHMYDTTPAAVDIEALNALRELGETGNRPIFQTEMQSDGMGTAVLVHQSLVVEGASAYLQGVLAGPASASKVVPGMLIALTSDSFSREPAYHALRHYALNTDPDWTRTDVDAPVPGVLVSAWISPDGDALTVVLVNEGATAIDIQLDLDGYLPSNSQVTRTVFDGAERSAELGPLPEDGTLRLPRRSIATVAARE
jgi:hypothetical protein